MMNKPLPFESQRSLKDLSTIGVGGPAELYLSVHSKREIQQALKYACAHNLRTFILGNGSNTLFDDQGFKGLIIHNKILFCEEPSDGVFHIGAGFNFSRLGSLTARNGWSGLEFASGIPGSVGGAVFMNAGANGAETCDNLVSVEFVDMNGKCENLQRSDLNFAYRRSPFQSMKGAIVSATFKLERSNSARDKQLSIIDYRTKTQPYGEKSAGCMFRNPEFQPAGALIEKCGLKGKQLGDAEISSLHGNFLINTNHASSNDILKLVDEVQTQVKSKYGIELESEVRYIPYSDNTISR